MSAPPSSIVCNCGAMLPIARVDTGPILLVCPNCGESLKITPVAPVRSKDASQVETDELRHAAAERRTTPPVTSRARGHTLFRRDAINGMEDGLGVRRHHQRHSGKRYRTKIVLSISAVCALLALISLILAINVDERYYPFGISHELMLISPIFFVGLAAFLVVYFAQENP